MLALDRLRAAAMLAGLFFHAALAHSPLVQPFFPTADASQAAALDLLLWPLHLVRMPLFFVIAGVLAARSLARHGMVGLMQRRARRLLLPLLVGVPLLHLAMTALIEQALQQVQRPSPLLRWLRQAGELSLPLGTGHLWFLYYLLLFLVLLWAARLLLPRGARAWLRALPLPAWLVGLPLLLTPALATVSAPHPAPEGLLPQFWALSGYGAYFAFGLLFGTRLQELAALRVLIPLGGAGALAGLAFLALLDAPRAQAGALLGAVSALASACLTLALIGLALRHFERDGPLLRYLSEASYWVYLVHLPLLFALQFAWMDPPWPWFVKLPLAVAATLVLSLLSYELLGRRLLGQPRASASTP